MNIPEDIHVIRLEADNANAIDEKLLMVIDEELDQALSANRKAVVLTGYDKFFSAGLNLKGLPDTKAGMSSFVDRFQEVNHKLLTLPRPLIGAINGHAIAGGCVVACACDLRIGAEGDYKVGVSEVSLGIIFPAIAFEIMRATINPPWATEVLLGGKLLTPNEAASAGILHEVVSADSLLERAVARAVELGGKPQRAFEHSKLALREPMLRRIADKAEETKEGFLETWFSEDVAARRKAMLA